MWQVLKFLKTYDILMRANSMDEAWEQGVDDQEHRFGRVIDILWKHSVLWDNPSIEKLKSKLRECIKSELSQTYLYEDENEPGLIFKRLDRLLQTIGDRTYLLLMRRYYRLFRGRDMTFKAYVRWRRDLKGIFDEGDYLWDSLVNCSIHEPAFLGPYPGYFFHQKINSVRKELVRKFKGNADCFQAD